MDEQLEKRNKLAADVLRLSRNTLVVNLRFLDAALSRLEPMAKHLAAYLFALAVNEHDCPIKVTRVGGPMMKPDPNA